jgi:hypothetical protein
VVTLGRTIGISGIRRTPSSHRTTTITWLVGSTLGGAGERVDYQVTINGVPQRATSALMRQIVRPDFSDVPSRMPGVTSGQAPFRGYRALIDHRRLPGGTIVVDAVASGSDGSIRVMESVTIHNDSDGVDRRPSSKVIHADADTGDDANDGSTWLLAVRTMNRAIYLAQANPGGTSSADRDCGGALIRARGVFYGGANGATGTQFPWHCTGDHWLEIEADAAGMQWGRFNQPWFTPGVDTVCMQGNGPGTKTRIRLRGCTILGGGPDGYVGEGVEGTVWREGCTTGSAYFVDDGTVSVRWADDLRNNNAWGWYAQNQADADACKTIVTGELRRGTLWSYTDSTFVYDCEAVGWLGNAFFVVGPRKSTCVLACVAALNRYSQGPGQVEGWVRHAGGTGFEIQVLGGGAARLLGPPGGYDFGRDAAGMLGSPQWGVGLVAFPTAANNGAFEITGTGVTGGRSFIDYLNPSAVAENGTPSSNIETWQRGEFGSSPYNVAVHGNNYSIGPERTGDDILCDIAVTNCTGSASSVFTNGEPHTRLLLDNLRGSADGKQIMMAEGDLTHSLIRRCTFTGPLFLSNFIAGGLPVRDFTGLEIVNCVFGSITPTAFEALAQGATIDSCHTISGPTIGTNATGGAPWFAGNPLASPWSAEPAAPRIGTGNPSLTDPEAWSWSPSATTPGVLKNVALLDWGADGTTVGNITAQAETVTLEVEAGPPGVRVGSIASSPAACGVTLGATGPVVLLEAVVGTPAAAVLEFADTAPAGVLGSIASTPAAVALQLTTGPPGTVLGSVAFTPPAAWIVFAVSDPNGVVTDPPEVPSVDGYFPARTFPGEQRARWSRLPFWK